MLVCLPSFIWPRRPPTLWSIGPPSVGAKKRNCLTFSLSFLHGPSAGALVGGPSPTRGPAKKGDARRACTKGTLCFWRHRKEKKRKKATTRKRDRGIEPTAPTQGRRPRLPTRAGKKKKCQTKPQSVASRWEQQAMYNIKCIYSITDQKKRSRRWSWSNTESSRY